VANDEVVRAFYDARDRRDWDAVEARLAPDAVWHEPADDTDYAGDHHGVAAVLALLQRLVEVTEGSFRLEPTAAVASDDHVAVRVVWQAERAGRTSEGLEIAVYRVLDGRVAEAWFFPDGYDPEALRTVFAFGR
jgi:ketosteroid isomerase-like protein